MIKVSRDEQENRVDSEHEDYADFDYDSIMADDKYSDFDFDGFMTIFYSKMTWMWEVKKTMSLTVTVIVTVTVRTM